MDFVTEEHIRTVLDRMLITGTLDEPKPKPVKRDVIRIAESRKPRFRTQQVSAIINVVSDLTGVSVVEIMGQRRSPKAVKARHLCYYFCRLMTNNSLLKLGDIFQRDHATILHGIRKIDLGRKYFEPEFSIAMNVFSSWGAQE